MRRPVECCASRRNNAVRIDQRTSNLQDCGGGAVDFVIGMENEELVQSFGKNRMRLVVWLRQVIQEIEEVSSV